MKDIIEYIKHPSLLLYYLDKCKIIRIEDKLYLKLLYKKIFKKELNLENPQTFNEKLQWLKLYDRNDLYTIMVDKYEAKKYVANLIGKQYIIPTLGIYDNFDNIDFKNLPEQFVLKCTHDSGSTIVCKDKKKFNVVKARNKINKSLKRNFYYEFREWPYKNVSPKIIIEKYIQNNNQNEELNDYKIFCFNGKPYMILVCSNRKGKQKNTDFFDIEWNKMEFTRENFENNKENIKKPQNLEEMLEISKKLSRNTIFLRVDLYEICGKVYFGELTFYPSSGFEGFKPELWDKKLGDMIQL